MIDIAKKTYKMQNSYYKNKLKLKNKN